MYECEYCGETFEKGRVKSNHIRWQHKLDDKGYSDEGYKQLKQKARSRAKKRHGEKVEESRNCKECEKEFSVSYRKEDSWKGNKKFCSQSCAATYSNKKRGSRSEETRQKISQTLKERDIGGRGRSHKKSLKKYKKDPSKCQICEKALPYEERTNKTCSENCKKELLRKKAIRNPKCGGSTGRSNGEWYYNKNEGEEVWLDSSWEVKFAKYLDEENIEWVRPSYFEWIDKDEVKRRYFPDFYLKQRDLYIDIKNDYLNSLEKTKRKIDNVQKLNDIDVEVLTKKDLDKKYQIKV